MAKARRTDRPPAPRHLRRSTQDWFRAVVADYELEPHHLKLLTAAAESWDRAQAAREIIAKEGCVIRDRFDQPKPHPGCAIERDAKTLFARLLRELGLDVEEPSADIRGPAAPKNAHLRIAR